MYFTFKFTDFFQKFGEVSIQIDGYKTFKNEYNDAEVRICLKNLSKAFNKKGHQSVHKMDA